MAINTLLEWLKETSKNFDLSFNRRDGSSGVSYVNIKNCKLKSYEYITRGYELEKLQITTDNGHAIEINISEFNHIEFDAIAFNATTASEMKNCLFHLEKEGRFHAYLRDANNECLLRFLYIATD